MTATEARARLSQLRQRDQALVRALIEHVTLGEKQIADVLGMNGNTLQHRRKRIFAVLCVGSRLELYAVYHALVRDCACLHDPSAGSEEVEMGDTGA